MAISLYICEYTGQMALEENTISFLTLISVSKWLFLNSKKMKHKLKSALLLCLGCSKLKSFFDSQRSHRVTEIENGFTLEHTDVQDLGLKIEFIERCS